MDVHSVIIGKVDEQWVQHVLKEDIEIVPYDIPNRAGYLHANSGTRVLKMENEVTNQILESEGNSGASSIQ
jgi:hypothetical protein